MRYDTVHFVERGSLEVDQLFTDFFYCIVFYEDDSIAGLLEGGDCETAVVALEDDLSCEMRHDADIQLVQFWVELIDEAEEVASESATCASC